MSVDNLLRDLDHLIPHADHDVNATLTKCRYEIQKLLTQIAQLERLAYDEDGNKYRDQASVRLSQAQQLEIDHLYDRISELEEVEDAWIASLREAIHFAGGVTTECHKPFEYIERLKESTHNMHQTIEAAQLNAIQFASELDSVRAALLGDSISLPVDHWLVDWCKSGEFSDATS